MKGFDVEFQDLDHYIRVITDRIWEGRRINDITRYYSDDCAVETPASVSIGVQAVIDGTSATLLAFPDRRLLAEDVIASGDEAGGYLSSHRIFSPMTHAGPGAFGPPTGKPLTARTVADCVCRDNRIVHEWLVRDQAAMARQIGLHERVLAQRWLNEQGGFRKPVMPPPPAPYHSFIDTDALAQRFADAYCRVWDSSGEATAAGRTAAMAALADDRVIAALPGGEAAVGQAAHSRFWAGLRAALQPQHFAVEHLVAAARPGRATAVAMRWRVQSTHAGAGRYGAPSGRPVQVLGISHAEFENGRMVREWVLIDDVALWMQVLEPVI